MNIKLTHRPDHDWAPWTAAVVVRKDGADVVAMFATATSATKALELLARMPDFRDLASRMAVAA